MPSKNIKKSLKDAAYDLKFLLNRGYKKKIALNLVTKKHLLNKNERNFLVRKVFSDRKSLDRKIKNININKIKDRTIFIDGYNVLITVESIYKHEFDYVIMCDDGVLRDLKAVFGKYKISSCTETALNCIITILKEHHPACIHFLYDSPVSKSGELASLTNMLIKRNGLNGNATTNKNVDFELVKLSKLYDGIVATSDGAVIDKIEKTLDIPRWICNGIK